MFKKILLFIIIGILSIQIFPSQWIYMSFNVNDFEQTMAMSEPDDETEIEFPKIIKDKIFGYDFIVSDSNCFELNNLEYHSFYILALQNISSSIICPPPNVA